MNATTDGHRAREVLATQYELIGDTLNAARIRAGSYVCEEVDVALRALEAAFASPVTPAAAVDVKRPGTVRCADPRGHEFLTWDLPADVGDGWTVAHEVGRRMLRAFEHGRQYQMEIVSNAMVEINAQRERDTDHV